MSGFTTDLQIIPASAVQTIPGAIVPPTAPDQVLSILPGRFSISEDTARLIASIAPHLLRIAA